MPSPTDSINIISIPADTGSIICGKHRAPQALLAAGLVPQLQAAGYNKITEINALPAGPAVWEPSSPSPNGVRNEARNVQVYHQVKDAVGETLSNFNPASAVDELPFNLLLGGGCDVLPAVLSAYHHHLHSSATKIALLYIDADTDLARPEPDNLNALGTLASMTMTHLLRLPSAAASMAPFTRPDGSGVVDAQSLVLFGLNAAAAGNTKEQMAFLLDGSFKVLTATAVSGDPLGRAREALSYLEARTDVIFVHLDVDAIDAGMFPLANVPNFSGLGFEAVMGAVGVFLGSGKVRGLCVGEVNPDHDPKGEMVGMLVERLVQGMSGRREG